MTWISSQYEIAQIKDTAKMRKCLTDLILGSVRLLVKKKDLGQVLLNFSALHEGSW